jgi:hypothetical protein
VAVEGWRCVDTAVALAHTRTTITLHAHTRTHAHTHAHSQGIQHDGDPNVLCSTGNYIMTAWQSTGLEGNFSPCSAADINEKGLAGGFDCLATTAPVISATTTTATTTITPARTQLLLVENISKDTSAVAAWTFASTSASGGALTFRKASSTIRIRGGSDGGSTTLSIVVPGSSAFPNFEVSATIQAVNLEGSPDKCSFEVSVDGGATWTETIGLVNNQENYFVTSVNTLANPSGGSLALRLKLTSNVERDYCEMLRVEAIGY